MANTTFVDGSTPLVASWFNDVNNFVYSGSIPSGGVPVPVASGGTGSTTASAARTALGLAIGTNVEAWNADLDALAALVSTGITVRTGSATYAQRSIAVGSANLTVSNGSGVSGNPTLDLGSSPSVSGSLTAGTTVTAGTGITATTGNIVATTGSLSVGTTVTAGTGVTATTGNIAATAGAITAGTTINATTSLTVKGSSTGKTIVNSANSSGSDNTLTLPASTDTIAGVGTAQTWTGVQQFGTIGGAVGKLVLAGSASGSSILNANAAAGSTTFTLPTTSGTVQATGTNVVVADGGTGVSTMTTAYAPITAGTTATGALQVASTGLATTRSVLMTNGSSALPSFQAFGGYLIATANPAGAASSTITVPAIAFTQLLIIYSNIFASAGGTLSLQIGGLGSGYANEIITTVTTVVAAATSGATGAFDLSASISLGTTAITAMSGYQFLTASNASSYVQSTSTLVKSVGTTTADTLICNAHQTTGLASFTGSALLLKSTSGTISGQWSVYALQ